MNLDHSRVRVVICAQISHPNIIENIVHMLLMAPYFATLEVGHSFFKIELITLLGIAVLSCLFWISYQVSWEVTYIILPMHSQKEKENFVRKL